MGCESCNYAKALGLAEAIVEENPGDIFTKYVKREKLAQLTVTRTAYEKLAPDCPRGVDATVEETDTENIAAPGLAGCGVENQLNAVLGLVLGKPAVEIAGYNQGSMNIEKM